MHALQSPKNVVPAVRLYFVIYINLVVNTNCICNCRKLVHFFCVPIEDGLFEVDLGVEVREKPRGIAFMMYSQEVETPRQQPAAQPHYAGAIELEAEPFVSRYERLSKIK